jgi:hypothetical protein
MIILTLVISYSKLTKTETTDFPLILPCLFQLFGAYGHQKLLRTAKRSAFQSASIKFVWLKTIQNQHKHIIGWVVAIVGIRHFLDPEPYGHLYLPPHVILMILRFSTQPDSHHSQILRKAGQKKVEPNNHMYTAFQICDGCFLLKVLNSLMILLTSVISHRKQTKTETIDFPPNFMFQPYVRNFLNMWWMFPVKSIEFLHNNVLICDRTVAVSHFSSHRRFFRIV